MLHLLAAADQLPADAGLVLCAGAADTPAERSRSPTPWPSCRPAGPGWCGSSRCCPATQLVPLITGATVFVVPSVYEPLGIVNLEAAACGTAVVASDVGGIPEVVDDGAHRPARALRRRRPAEFAAGLADRIAELLADPARAAAMGAAGRERVLAEFGWPAIAQQTVEVYETVLAARG